MQHFKLEAVILSYMETYEKEKEMLNVKQVAEMSDLDQEQKDILTTLHATAKNNPELDYWQHVWLTDQIVGEVKGYEQKYCPVEKMRYEQVHVWRALNALKYDLAEAGYWEEVSKEQMQDALNNVVDIDRAHAPLTTVEAEYDRAMIRQKHEEDVREQAYKIASGNGYLEALGGVDMTPYGHEYVGWVIR